MRRIQTLTVALLFAVVGIAPAAVASPPHGDGGHTHHVHTPHGCVDVDAVAFLAEDRGLHQGGNSSSSEQGIWHGPCHLKARR